MEKKNVHNATIASNESPNLISAVFTLPPPPISDLPRPSLNDSTSTPHKEARADKRIGLFELRRRLGAQHTAPSTHELTVDDLVGWTALLCLCAAAYIAHCEHGISHIIASLGEVLVALMHICAALSLFGVAAGVCSSSFASYIHDALSPPYDDQEDEVPLPPPTQRAKYLHMIEERETHREHYKSRRGRGRLLGLSIDEAWPTDAGGAPIDVDGWGD